MDELLVVEGGAKLHGQICVGGAKNAALPMMIASVLTADRCTFRNVPALKDISILLKLLESLGGQYVLEGDSVSIATPQIISSEASYGLVKALRASFWVLGPLLARTGKAKVSLPGGDIIGARPVDMHIAVLSAMGAEISVKHGVVNATANKGLSPVEYEFSFPSVGATHQALMTAALVPGESCFRGVAREPEIVALAEMLTAMGAPVSGAGTSVIRIQGQASLSGCETNLPGDRIEAATYILAAIATRSSLTVTGVKPDHLSGFLPVLESMGASLAVDDDRSAVTLSCDAELRPVRVQTQPFPGFATDIQAPLVAALATIPGESVVEERIFEGRFGHISELCRMGADIHVFGSEARIRGVPHLTGARVEARDIRAGAALVVAALAAEGRSDICDIDHIRRGYSRLEEKLLSVGANIRAETADAEDYLFSGCF